MNRRNFLLNSIACLAGLTNSRRAAEGATALPVAPSAALGFFVNLDVRIAAVGGAERFLTGIRFGLQEAQHAARLFGASASLREFADGDADAVAAIVTDRRTIVVCADVTAAITRAAADGQCLVLNAGAPAGCEPFLFHLARTRAATELVWHDALERYGAAQLNARYAAAHDAAMDGDVWLGWLAVKIAWESAVRAQSTDPGVLAGYLTRNTTVFDGHKGQPLRFDPRTRVLRQPYYRAVDLGPVMEETTSAKGACD